MNVIFYIIIYCFFVFFLGKYMQCVKFLIYKYYNKFWAFDINLIAIHKILLMLLLMQNQWFTVLETSLYFYLLMLCWCYKVSLFINAFEHINIFCCCTKF